MRVPKKVWIPVVVIAALVGAYALAGFWWAPRLIRAEFTRFVAQDLKKLPRLGEVKVNPFTLRASIADLGIHEPSGERIVGFSRLDLDLSIRSIWKRGPVFDDITVERPFVSAVVRQDRTLNLAELVPPDKPGAKPAPPEPAAADDGLPVFIDLFTMHDGEAQYRDLSMRRPVQARLQPVTFQLRDFSTRLGSGNAHTLSAVSEAGERLGWSGSFKLKPFTAQGRFTLAGLRAATIDHVLQDSLPLQLQAGTFGLGARYDVTAATTPVSGRVLIDTIDAKDVALAAQGRKQPDLVIADAQLRGASIDLGARHADLGKVAVTGAQVRAWMDAQGVSLTALAGPDTPPERATPEAGPPWTVALSEFALGGSRVDFEDRTLPLPARFAITGVTLNARGFSTKPGTKLAFDTAFGINAKGRLESSGTLRPDDLETRAKVTLRDLPLTDFEPYYADLVRLNLRGGSIDAQGDLVYASPGAGRDDAEPTLAFKGDGAVRNLVARDRLVKRTFLRWRALRFNDIDYSGADARLSVRSIDADAPYIDLVINADGTTNISDVLRSDATTPEAERRARAAERAKHTARPETEDSPLRVDIGRVDLKGGSANFADFTVRPNFVIGLQTLNGSVTGLSSLQSSRAKVDIDAAVDKYAPVKITGEVNYLAAEAYTNLAANFRNIELTTFNPYSGKFMGYRIEKGKLSIDTTYLVEDRKLRAQHKVLVSQLKLGDKVKSPDATKLPVKLAVALLKDRDGNIRLDLPVSGTIDDPKFKLGPIIWKMFVNLLVKIVTSPFTLISSLFGGGPEVQFADFAPGRSTLEPAVAERLATVRKALIERPALEMEIPTAYSRELDAPALLDTRWDARLADFSRGPVDTTDRDEYLEVLDGLYRAQTGQKPDALLEPLDAPDPKTGAKPSREALREASIAALEARLRSTIEVTDKDLEDLARARAKAVQEALLGSGEIDPLRVFLRAPAGIAPTANSVRLKLELKQ